MTNRYDIARDLEPNLNANEREGLLAVAERLVQERPLPAASFRGDLGRRLARGEHRRLVAPRRLRLAIASYLGSGALLLAVPAIGIFGAGPFAT